LANTKITKSYSMKIFKNLFFLICILSYTGCSSNSEKQQNKGQQEVKADIAIKENFPTGQVIDKVNCKSDTSLSYSLYLPKGYDTKKTFPVIYAFDPHATGKIPVSMYKDLAEKFGFIIVGSNNSQNGMAWEQSEAIASTLFSDTRNRLSINDSRIYLLGFSGGARVANALTITNSTIAGVICCGAAYPAKNVPDPRNNYSFFGIAGNADFNLTELRKYDAIDLSVNKVEHSITTFDGKHEWPPVQTMKEAFSWLQLGAMRKNTLPKNDTLIASNIAEAKNKLSEYLKENKEYEAYILCKKTISYYQNLGDLSFFFDTYKKLQTSAAIDKQLKENEAEIANEEKLKSEYVGSFGTKSFEWWSKTISDINQKIKTGKNKEEVLIQKRILSYLSLVCYMQTSSSLKQNNIPAAEYACKMYLLVDPTNSEADYLMAEIQAEQGKKNEAIKSLEHSVKNGFTDKKRLENDSVFIQLKTDPGFLKLVEKIK
jgi:dienelactone hydrolase